LVEAARIAALDREEKRVLELPEIAGVEEGVAAALGVSPDRRPRRRA